MPKTDHNITAFLPQLITFDDAIPVATNPHEDTDTPVTDLHYHDCLEISYCVEGSGVFFLEDKRRSYRDGDLVIIPSNCTHRSMSAPNSQALWKTLYIDLSRLVQIPRLFGFSFREPPLLFLQAQENHEVLSALESIMQEYGDRKHDWVCNIMGNLYVVFTTLSRLPQSEQITSASKFRSLEKLAPALTQAV